MSQLRLNNLMVLHTYKEEADTLDLDAVINEFVSVKESISSIWSTLAVHWNVISHYVSHHHITSCMNCSTHHCHQSSTCIIIIKL